MQEIEINGKRYPLDENGYLADMSLWDRDFANAMAERDHLTLTDEHWQVIEFLRDYYQETDTAPAMRIFLKALKSVFGPDQANSRNLYRLFPYGPAKQAAKYAGLPKPPHCV